ncbi:MAG: cytochrome c oxidase subunit II [Solirubrobacteraceae bacterium]|nr:cytochrome c oxidase subunit II [Solirubrobacteraceae bacterium]
MGEETRRGPVPRRTWAALLAVVLAASIVGVVLALAIRWFPTRASDHGKSVDTLWDVLLIVSVPIFVLVVTLVVFSIWRWRAQPGEEHLDGPPIHGDTRLEIIWTALPTAIIAGLAAYAAVVLLDIQEAPAKGTRVVNVTGQQFAWSFSMTEGGRRIAVNRLVLPVGEPVEFKVRSKDVIHDFWVPEWRLKVDAVPGITTSYSLTPTRTGSYQVVCAELCGLGHAFMRQSVSVVSRERYAAWVRERTAPPATAPAGGAGPKIDAKQLFTAGNPQTGATACGACHALAAAGTTAQTGPDLAALKGWDAARIRTAIVDPNAELAKGFGANIMPPNYAQSLTGAEIDALVQYLRKSVGG